MTVFGNEAESLVQQSAYELKDINQSPNRSQVVKDILNKLIGYSFVFELKVSEYSFRGEVRQSLTTTKAFPNQFETESSLVSAKWKKIKKK
ncbi:hypothetical protein IFM89_018824 [Coptis chinensis]|uniref:Replication factor A C-terminal domain-containing protein n=1 Tax=Coptis chinensis TaxID=261450 RepID=A0A835H1N6_9MAGN|nr:hypothetical protein IFM89_018824 [Coptis chinensis]